MKPIEPVGQAAKFKFEFNFKPLSVSWQSLPKALPEALKIIEGLIAKSTATLGPRSGTAWAGQTG